MILRMKKKRQKYPFHPFFALKPSNIFKGKNGTEKQGRIYGQRVVEIRV
jgi:hypothetical protein